MERKKPPSKICCAAVSALIALGGCAVGGPEQTAALATRDGAPSKALAVQASTRPSKVGSRSTKSPRKNSDVSENAGKRNDSNDGRQKNDGRTAEPGASLLASISDETGDVADTPRYADVTAMQISDLGSSVSVSVTMAGVIPPRLPEGEVEGIGVDLTRGEDEYQVFASGEPDGWFGYLYTPDGFVKYRGDLVLRGTTLIFEVDWSEIGGRGERRSSTFVDWSGRGGVGRNPYSQDLAPESGTVTWEH